jgi:hypothetical protein
MKINKQVVRYWIVSEETKTPIKSIHELWDRPILSNECIIISEKEITDTIRANNEKIKNLKRIFN